MRVDDHVRIASITKTFTATVILRLVDQHRLRLNAHLDQFVSGIPNGNRITVRQLLGMRAGVYDYTLSADFIDRYFPNPAGPFGATDVLNIIRHHPPAFPPGTDTQYSNSDYVLLGLIAEKVTGEPLGRLIRQMVLKPLGLRHTRYATTPAMPKPFSHGYLIDPVTGPRDVTFSNPGYASGAGAMISTLGDLRKWVEALTNGTLLSPKMQRLRLQLHVLSPGPPIHLTYGLGIIGLNDFLGHDGGIIGYSTAMFRLPKEHATIIVETNSDNASSIVAPAIFSTLASYLYPSKFPEGLS
jgi:D-alanyl-D-alanine carboxypeptidase